MDLGVTHLMPKALRGLGVTHQMPEVPQGPWNYSSNAQGPSGALKLLTYCLRALYSSFLLGALKSLPETHTKRQAIQHDCLPSLLGDGDKELQKCTVRKK